MRARLQQAKLVQQRNNREQISSWMNQFDSNRTGKLERDELASLLMYLHPESGYPDNRALDLLITQATEIRAYSMHLKGDPNGAVGRDMLMPVVSGYAMYLLASAAFEKRACEGVVLLSELPGLMREANAGVDCEDSDVDFVVDCASSSRGGNLDSASSISREDLIPAFAAWKITQITEDTDLDAGHDDEDEGGLHQHVLHEDDEDDDMSAHGALDGDMGALERLREVETEEGPPVGALRRGKPTGDSPTCSVSAWGASGTDSCSGSHSSSSGVSGGASAPASSRGRGIGGSSPPKLRPQTSDVCILL